MKALTCVSVAVIVGNSDEDGHFNFITLPEPIFYALLTRNTSSSYLILLSRLTPSTFKDGILGARLIHTGLHYIEDSARR